jgi:hypothetical protein
MKMGEDSSVNPPHSIFFRLASMLMCDRSCDVVTGSGMVRRIVEGSFSPTEEGDDASKLP